MIDVALLTGSDFDKGSPGVGIQKAMRQVREKDSGKSIGWIKDTLQEDIRKHFTIPNMDNIKICLTTPDTKSLKRLLIAELRQDYSNISEALKEYQKGIISLAGKS
jgi:hypothetical protein